MVASSDGQVPGVLVHEGHGSASGGDTMSRKEIGRVGTECTCTQRARAQTDTRGTSA